MSNTFVCYLFITFICFQIWYAHPVYYSQYDGAEYISNWYIFSKYVFMNPKIPGPCLAKIFWSKLTLSSVNILPWWMLTFSLIEKVNFLCDFA